MNRTAKCECGNLSISVDGTPHVLICNCDSCQRRTGSAFGISAYLDTDDILAVEGAFTAFTRESQFARTITFSFCPTCGTSVFWKLESRPNKTGIAGGCFTDPDFPAPTSAYHVADKLSWVVFPEDVEVHED